MKQIDTPVDVAVVCGGGINAHSILLSLSRLSWQGRVVLLRHASQEQGFVECVSRSVEVWAPEILDNNSVPGMLEDHFGNAERIFVLFTDEKFHPAFAAWARTHPESRIRAYVGSVQLLSEILDRYLFCQFISDRALAQVPKTIQGTDDPFDAFGESFIVRPRYSWRGLAQRERVKLVKGRDEYAAALQSFASRGLKADDLSFQELLSIRNEDNVSICGWYGPDKQHLYCTRKVLQWPPSTGGGDLVERIDPPVGLMQQATTILKAFEYEGPFELEFVFDANTHTYKVIELNPRFWLQHGLIEAITGCALVSGCLGCEPLPVSEREQGLRYWVNPLYSCSRALKLDLRSMRCWLSPASWAPFGLRDAVRYGVHYCWQKLR